MSASVAPSAPAPSAVPSAPIQLLPPRNELPGSFIRDLERGHSPDPNIAEESSDQGDGRDHAGRNSPPITGITNRLLRPNGIDIPSREVSIRTIPGKPTILRVVDLSFDGNENPIIQFECEESETLRAFLADLPLQLSRTVREFTFNFHFPSKDSYWNSSCQDLRSHLADLGVDGIEEPKESDISNFLHLTSQWQDKGDRVWFGTRTLVIRPDMCAYMQCIPLENDKLIALYSFPVPGLNGGRLSTLSDSSSDGYDEGRLSNLRDSWSGCIPKGKPRSMSMLGSFLRAYSQHSTTTSTSVSKFLVLNFLHDSLRFAVETLEIRVSTIRGNQRLYGSTSLDHAAVDEHNDEGSKYQTFVDAAQDIVDSIDFVISSIARFRIKKMGTAAQEDTLSTEEFDTEEIFETVRGTSVQLKKLAASLNSYIERRYSLYLSTLNIHESESVKRLTALAAGFLPLSLGATLLSMQTRFADLKLLLYDFVGVGFILFFLMFVVFLLLKLVMKTASWRPFGRAVADFHSLSVTPEEARKLQAKADLIEMAPKIDRYFCIALGVYTMVSFVVGMFKNVALGLEIWGYGVAALVGLLLLSPIGVFFVLIIRAVVGAYRERTRRDQPGISDDDASHENRRRWILRRRSRSRSRRASEILSRGRSSGSIRTNIS